MTEHEPNHSTATKEVVTGAAESSGLKTNLSRLFSLLWKWFCKPVGILGVALLVALSVIYMICLVPAYLGGEKTAEVPPTIAAGRLCVGASMCDPAAYFQGSINAKSVGQLQAFMDDHPKLTWICLDSEGGNSVAGMAMAKWIREKKLNTCVAPRRTSPAETARALCGSACANIWLAGVSRRLSPAGGIVGFHGRYVGVNSCCAPANAIERWRADDYSLQQGLLFGDGEARRILNEKSRHCGPEELYPLRTQEAVELKLLPHESTGMQWAWVPDDPEIKFRGPVKALDCSK